MSDPPLGVIATSPATMPEAAPSVVAWPSRNRSRVSQPIAPAAAAQVVVTKTTAAAWLAPRAEPALKPYQPNHSRPAPSITRVRLCGRIASLPNPTRVPTTMASASAEAPEQISTAMPPAKSMVPTRLASQPPVCPSRSKSKTQCATGA